MGVTESSVADFFAKKLCWADLAESEASEFEDGDSEKLHTVVTFAARKSTVHWAYPLICHRIHRG